MSATELVARAARAKTMDDILDIAKDAAGARDSLTPDEQTAITDALNAAAERVRP